MSSKIDKKIPLPTIGEFLLEYMEPLNLSAYKVAKLIHVPVSRIQDILHNRRKMTIDTSMRLGKLFGVHDLFFFEVQLDIDYRKAKRELVDELKAIKPLKRNPESVELQMDK